MLLNSGQLARAWASHSLQVFFSAFIRQCKRPSWIPSRRCAMSRERGKALIGENLSIALDILCTHKMRSGLIVLGVAIGIAALMGMVSILLGLGESIGQRVRSAEATVLMVNKFDFLVGGFDESMLHRKDITEDDAKAIRSECPSLNHVGYVIRQLRMFNTLRSGNEKSRMFMVMGAEPALMYVYNLDLEVGRVFTDEE